MLSLGSQYNQIFYIMILINEIIKKSISKINSNVLEFTVIKTMKAHTSWREISTKLTQLNLEIKKDAWNSTITP